MGWNTFQLNQGYAWDGFSNLIVEICYDNLSSLFTYNWSTPYDITSYNSTLFQKSDVTNTCTNTSVKTTSNKRPLTRFKSCNLPADTNTTLQWNPTNGLSNNNILNPIVTTSQNTTFDLVATAIQPAHQTPCQSLLIIMNLI